VNGIHFPVKTCHQLCGFYSAAEHCCQNFTMSLNVSGNLIKAKQQTLCTTVATSRSNHLETSLEAVSISLDISRQIQESPANISLKILSEFTR